MSAPRTPGEIAAAASASASNASSRVRPMDNAHVMDWAPLHLGHPTASRRDIVLVDLPVQVFGLDEIAGSDLPVAVILLTHGWANKARDMHPMASGLIGEARRLDERGGRKRTRDVVVVTLDCRNHGERRRVKDGLSYDRTPRQYAVYMSMQVTGGVHDHKLVMDFLPAMLFPNDERHIVEFMTTGFSMGGHIGWRLLRNDDRINIFVPICSIPSEVLRLRLLTSPLPPGTSETYVPESVKAFFNAPCPTSVYRGKKILAIHGGLDFIMPWHLGAQRWEEIRTEAGAAERWIDEGFGHVVTPGMVEHAAEWFWRWGLTEEK